MFTKMHHQLAAVLLAALPLSVTAQPNIAPQNTQSAPAAQQPQLTPEQQNLLQNLQSTQLELQKIQKKIQSIQIEIFQNNEALEKERLELQAKVQEQMNQGGFDADKEFKELQAIITKYQTSGEKPSEEVIANFQQRQRALQQRQQMAVQNPEIRQMGQALDQKIRAEMIKKDANNKDLFEKVNELSSKLQTMRAQFQQSLAQPQAMPTAPQAN